MPLQFFLSYSHNRVVYQSPIRSLSLELEPFETLVVKIWPRALRRSYFAVRIVKDYPDPAFWSLDK